VFLSKSKKKEFQNQIRAWTFWKGKRKKSSIEW